MMKKIISRRRFMTSFAMVTAYSAMPLSKVLASMPLHRWNGILMGAHVHLTLAHPSERRANEIFKKAVQEIKRLEQIFTLYDSHSELSRLNREGHLKHPSSEMMDILQKARSFHSITGGVFDITVHAFDKHKDLDLIGMDWVETSYEEVRFSKAGMSITLNGIAQGYITDKITELLKAEGLKNVLVELGEKRAIGAHPHGRPWLISVEGKHDPIPLLDLAMATSAHLNADTKLPHILDPTTGQYTNTHKTASVIAKDATTSDAMSTSFISLSEKKIDQIKQKLPQIKKVLLA